MAKRFHYIYKPVNAAQPPQRIHVAAARPLRAQAIRAGLKRNHLVSLARTVALVCTAESDTAPTASRCATLPVAHTNEVIHFARHN